MARRSWHVALGGADQPLLTCEDVSSSGGDNENNNLMMLRDGVVLLEQGLDTEPRRASLTGVAPPSR